MQSFIQQVITVGAGVNYLVPQFWFEEFLNTNNNAEVKSIEQLSFPELDMSLHVDHFLFEYKQTILQELDYKCNFIEINKIIISPQPSKSINWKAISPTLWKKFKTCNQNSKISVLTFADAQGQIVGQLKQVQIVFYSKMQRCGFVGYFNKKVKLLELVRALMVQFEFTQTYNSRIMLVGSGNQKTHNLYEIQHMMVRQLDQYVLMIYNLQKGNIPGLNADSTSALAQDIIQMSQYIPDQQYQKLKDQEGQNQSLFGTDPIPYQKEHRIKELIKDAKPEVIQTMKKKAKQASMQSLIQLPAETLQIMQESLQEIAQEIIRTCEKPKKKVQQIYSKTTKSNQNQDFC